MLRPLDCCPACPPITQTQPTHGITHTPITYHNIRTIHILLQIGLRHRHTPDHIRICGILATRPKNLAIKTPKFFPSSARKAEYIAAFHNAKHKTCLQNIIHDLRAFDIYVPTPPLSTSTTQALSLVPIPASHPHIKSHRVHIPLCE